MGLEGIRAVREEIVELGAELAPPAAPGTQLTHLQLGTFSFIILTMKSVL